MISQDIAPLLPHCGNMRLIERVLACDPVAIHCASASHRAVDHPLRRAGRLGVFAAIEYAAQAMAIHCGLLELGSGKPARNGLLALVRDTEIKADRLDDIQADLDIRAERLVEMPDALFYQFEVSAAGRSLVTGRAAICFPDEWKT